MTARSVTIPTNAIVDDKSFHSIFAEAFGFPSWYGKNFDALIDCLTYLDEPESGMTSVHVERGQIMRICLEGGADLKIRCPGLYSSAVKCLSFVNERRLERGSPAVLSVEDV